MPGETASNINLIGILFISGMILLSIFLPRRLATLPIIVSACFMTLGQQVEIGGFHFYVYRIMILMGWARLFVRHEIKGIKINIIDKLIIIYTCGSFITNFFLWETFDAIKNQLGFSFNVIGLYFLFRFLVKDYQDIEDTIKILCLVAIPLAGLMVLEKFSGRNIFSVLGGVSELTINRDGHLRCQGAFRHPILAGTFGATSMPLVISLWLNPLNRKIIILLGIFATLIITITAASSGPAMAYGFGVIGLMAWTIRNKMRFIRWGIAASIIILHMVMKAPVWFLMARINLFSSSTGWHRANLIDQALKHIDEWWLIGTKYTAHWFPYGLAIDTQMADITNQFIGEGVTGGLLKMFLFILIIALGFQIIGKAWRKLKKGGYPFPFQIWCIGACLFVHTVSFFSIGYFDQIIVFWYMILAFIATIRSLQPIAVKERNLDACLSLAG